jgi:hypothetical protein
MAGQCGEGGKMAEQGRRNKARMKTIAEKGRDHCLLKI